MGPDALAELLGTRRARARDARARIWPVHRRQRRGLAALGGPATRAGADQARLFDLIKGVLERLADDRPLGAGARGDLHWSDPATRDLLDFVVRHMAGVRLLLIGTFRTFDLEPGDPLLAYFANLERLPRVERIDLRPLSAAEQRDQLRAILGRPVRGGWQTGSSSAPTATRSSPRSCSPRRETWLTTERPPTSPARSATSSSPGSR